MASHSHIESLAEAVEELVLRRGGRGGGVVIAEKLAIRDAAVFEMMMEVLTDADDDWVLRNGDGVKATSRVCTTLLLLQRALLPALRWRPTNKPLLRVVSASAEKLREVAHDAGGSVRKEAALVADPISTYIDDSLQVPNSSSVDTMLRDRVDTLVQKCADLLGTDCTINQNQQI